jgi:hypothetical protein
VPNPPHLPANENVDEHPRQASSNARGGLTTISTVLGILLVLDLTDHHAGWLDVRDAVWVKHLTSEHGYVRSAVVAVVAGNRPTPRFVKLPRENDSQKSMGRS